MAVTIQLPRPLFQIQLGETIDEVFQFVLYHRRQVPVLVSALVDDSDVDDRRDVNADLVRSLIRSQGKKVDRFRNGWSAVRDGVRNIFRSANGNISRAAIIIGASPSAPIDVYVIEFRTDGRRDKKMADSNGQSNTSLTNGERRQISRQLIDQGFCYLRGDRDLKSINRATKTFLFVEAARDVGLTGFSPRPDLDFLQYCVDDVKLKPKYLRSVNWTLLKIDGNVSEDEKNSSTISSSLFDASPCLSSSNVISVGSEGDDEEKELIWYQFQESVFGFDE